jgi:hypothetical protein
MPPSPVELDRFIDALPRHPLSAPRRAPASFPEWRWPMSKPYNGFSPVERVRGWQVSKWLQAAGSLPYPRQCDVCRGAERVALHSESYYHIGRAPGVCRRCHRAIHRRHREPEPWRQIIERFSITGTEWFAIMPPPGTDVAAHLREERHWHAADLAASLSKALPSLEAQNLPSNLMSHPKVATNVGP